MEWPEALGLCIISYAVIEGFLISHFIKKKGEKRNMTEKHEKGEMSSCSLLVYAQDRSQ